MNKSEVAAKLKSSIEAKLCSLGAYVDKELPEYILVMIANKKNKELMEKDLQLFLGQDTTLFITWLHELLNKCNENPETAFISNNSKSPEVVEQASRRSPDKKKKKEKNKSKKGRRSDDKKEIKKGSVAKEHKTRSRSISPRKSKLSSHDEQKVVCTPDKSSKKVNLESRKDDIKVAETSNSAERPQQHVMSSIVKVTERPAPKIDTLKTSALMIQRDIKEVESSKKRESSQQQKEQPPSEVRSSVFSRLGKGDLRSKLSTKTDGGESHRKNTVKRSVNRDGSMDSEDDPNTWHRQSKITKSNDSKTANKEFFDRDEPNEGEDGSTTWYRLAKPMRSKSDFNEESNEVLQSNVEKTKEEKVLNFQDSDIEEDTSIDKRHSKIQNQPEEEKIVSTNFIVTLKGAEKLNLSLKSRLGPKKTSTEMFPIEDDTETNSMETAETEALEVADVAEMEVNEVVTVSNQLSKCKFWPNCKNKDSCPFFHPHELCTNFPNCKFGTVCLYVHPDCRFEPHCTKHDCPFTHRQPKVPSQFSASVKISAAPCGMQQRCVFYPNCTNVNCKFFHPNLPCRFGLACKAKDTCMFYHPSIPHRTELKWVAGTETPASKTQTSTAQKVQAQSS